MARAIALLHACAFALTAHTQTTAYDRGPNGLEAWTDDHHTRQFRINTEPFGIVIARHGKRIRSIGRKDGGPFFWNLMLLADGKRIAYEHGPFHFVMTCTLMDIATGRKLEEVPCWTEEEIDADPQWVRDLEAKGRHSASLPPK